MKPPPPSSSKKFQIWPVLIGVSLSVVVTIGILIVVVLLVKRRRPAMSTSSSADNSPHEPRTPFDPEMKAETKQPAQGDVHYRTQERSNRSVPQIVSGLMHSKSSESFIEKNTFEMLNSDCPHSETESFASSSLSRTGSGKKVENLMTKNSNMCLAEIDDAIQVKVIKSKKKVCGFTREKNGS